MLLGIPAPPRHWLYAALVGAVAVALRAVAQPLLGDALPFLVAFPATVLAALRWGAGPGLVTALLCAGAVAVPWLPPDMEKLDRPLQIGGYLVAAVVTCLLCGQLRGKHQAEPAFGLQAPDTPLTAWLRAVLWGAFLVPSTAFVMAAWWGYERVRHEAEVTVAHAGDLALNHALRTFTAASLIASRADAACPFDDASSPEPSALMHQRLADMAAGVPSIVNINVWDANGRAIARSDKFPVSPDASIADRPYFLEQKAGRALGISEVIIGRQTGQELTNLTIRRSSADGSFRGVVAVSISPGFFRDYYWSLTNEEPGLATFALMRSDGVILARSPDLRTAAAMAVERPIREMMASGAASGNVELPATSSREARLIAFRRVGDFPLFVSAGFSKDKMLASWFGFVSLLAAIVVPLTTVLVYVSWVALKKTRWQLTASAELNEQTQRRAAAERSMLESQKLETLAFVTSGVAHDFNNLLAIVSASLHVLKKRQPELGQEKHVVAMTKAIQSGVRLTRQLLSFSKKQALRPESVVLQSWLPSEEGLIQSTLGPNTRWELDVDPATAPVHVDLGELELALINLVVNARHAMPNGGTLKISAANASLQPEGGKPMVLIAVEDTGVGIAPELLDKVLQPFFTTRSKGAGSGLGLSQVQGFCVEAGGSVRIKSVVGHGTAVCMYIPAAAPSAADLASAQRAEPARELRGRVLLVEDNDDVASTTELVLRTAGLEVVRVASADAALAYLTTAAEWPALVLSDIAMPGSMSGIGLAFELRARAPGLPVILNTGYAEQLAEATAGGLRVLQKPIAPDELLSEIEALLNQALSAASTKP